MDKKIHKIKYEKTYDKDESIRKLEDENRKLKEAVTEGNISEAVTKGNISEAVTKGNKEKKRKMKKRD